MALFTLKVVFIEKKTKFQGKISINRHCSDTNGSSARGKWSRTSAFASD